MPAMARRGQFRAKPSACHSSPSLAAELGELIRMLTALFDGYRPERHYMRGPGPRWRATHSPSRRNSACPGALALIRAPRRGFRRAPSATHVT
jgi:hypothetical protein